MLSVKYDLITVQNAAFEQLRTCLQSININKNEEESFQQQTINVLLFSLLILLVTNGDTGNIANQFMLYSE